MKTSGNVILITGGGTGIGRGLAEALLAQGNEVIVAGRRRDALEQVAGADVLVLDITSRDSIEAGVQEVLAKHPALDVLVNNAGIMTDIDLAEPVDDDELVATVTTNLLGPVRLVSALIGHLRSVPEAAIVNVTSMLGYAPLARAPIYSATKAAMHSYTLALRHRLGDDGPEVIEIAPPLTRTALQPINLTDPRAMPLEEFIAQTMDALAAGGPEAYVGFARERRDAQRVDDVGITRRFNELLGHPAGGPPPSGSA